MIRRKTGFKEIAIGSLLGVALVSVACSDGDGQPLLGSAGTSGSANTAGTRDGGASIAGTSTGGTTAGGATTGGTTTGGTTTGGTTTGGTGGSEGGTGGSEGGMSNSGGAGDQAAGEGGAAGAGGDWAAGGQGGEGGEGGEPFVADTLDNPGFEVGTSHVNIPGWTNEGTPDAAYIEYASAHGGFGKLGHWMPWTSGGANLPFTARTFQTVSPIAKGKYSVSVWLKRDWFKQQYLFVKGHNAAAPEEQLRMCHGDCATQDVDQAAPAQAEYVKITLSGIDVTSGSITLGVFSDGPAGSSASFDDFQLTRE